MRNFLTALILALVFSGTAFSQSGWYNQVNPLGSGQQAMTGKIQFVSATEGWISLGNGKLLHTTNSGANWVVVTPEPVDTLFSWSDPAQSISFINLSTGWMLGNKGSFSQWNGAVVYKTTNGGSSWTKLTIPAYDAGIYIQFVDASNGWILLFNTNYTGGGIFRTTNGGLNWNALNPPVGGFPYFINSSTGWLIRAGENSTTTDSIRKTTNGGLNWTVPWGTNNIVSYNSIHFSDINNGWAVGKNGVAVKTTNGGNSWNYVTNFGGVNYNNNAVFFLNPNTGWIGSKHELSGISYVFYTNNGGSTWNTQIPPISTPPEFNRIFSIHFWDAQNGGLTADYGKICHTSSGGVRVNIISTEIPGKYSLSQNYPNPFNPETKIRFTVQRSGFVKIAVFDAAGREVETIVNKNLEPGIYEAEWIAEKYSSGIYFARMESGSFFHVIKMMLIR